MLPGTDSCLVFCGRAAEESSVQIAASIFKAYDIRGIVPATLNEAVARGVGRAFGMAALAEGGAGARALLGEAEIVRTGLRHPGLAATRKALARAGES